MSKLIGTDPDQVPSNADLGTLAFQNADNPSMADLYVEDRIRVGAKSGRGGGATAHIFTIKDGDFYFELQQENTNGNTDILFSDGTSGDYGVLGYEHSNDRLIMYSKSNLSATIQTPSGGETTLSVLARPSTYSQPATLSMWGTNSNQYGGSVIAQSQIRSKTAGGPYASKLEFHLTDGSNNLNNRMELSTEGALQIDNNLTVNGNAATLTQNTGGSATHSRNQILNCVNVISGANSGVWTDVAFVSHSPNLQVQGMTVQAGNASLGGGRFMGAVKGTYGSVGMHTEYSTYLAMNGGNISGATEYRYLNGGASSGAYRLQVRIFSNDGSPDFYQYTLLQGQATNAISED